MQCPKCKYKKANNNIHSTVQKTKWFSNTKRTLVKIGGELQNLETICFSEAYINSMNLYRRYIIISGSYIVKLTVILIDWFIVGCLTSSVWYYINSQDDNKRQQYIQKGGNDGTGAQWILIASGKVWIEGWTYFLPRCTNNVVFLAD
jgi:hypothetical protein